MRTYNVAVAGALGLVGTTMVRILEEYEFPVNELRLLERRELAGRAGEVPRPRSRDHRGDAAMRSTGSTSRCSRPKRTSAAQLVPEAVRRGAVAIDNSRAYRLDPAVPLVVPEVNPEDLAWHPGIVANPNCTTIGTVVVLKPIHDLSPIRRLVASTYQSTSGGAAPRNAGAAEADARRGRRLPGDAAAGVQVPGRLQPDPVHRRVRGGRLHARGMEDGARDAQDSPRSGACASPTPRSACRRSSATRSAATSRRPARSRADAGARGAGAGARRPGRGRRGAAAVPAGRSRWPAAT